MADAAAAKEGSADQVEVRVLFFAAAKDLAGCAGTTIRISPTSNPHFALNSVLLPKYPSLAALAPYCALAVNLEYADASEDAVSPPFRNGDELAIIPPISVGASEAGAISVFVGTTRCSFENKRVVSLEYEAYVPMAEREMAKLCASARAKWSDLIGVAVYHRLGSVPVREASVIIAVSSPHRKDALDACHFVIDELKASVPIWKRECYEDGSVWKENSEFSGAKPL